jgi:lysyl endopeptidase
MTSLFSTILVYGYKKNGFIKIERWEQGVTESGSSGGGLFNKNNMLIGTLTGGAATCSNPVRDYFARFDMAWNYRPEITKQLKHWLDPKNTGATTLNGNRFYEDEELCGAFTNLVDTDQHRLIEITENGSFAGYWGGTNNTGVTEFMEKFSIDGDEQLQGISIGVGKLVDNLSGSEFTIKVYNGGSVPQTLIYSEKFKLNQLYSNAMNYLKFNQVVRPGTSFFIGFELSNMNSRDTLAIYQTIRPSAQENTFYYKKGNIWYNFKFASGNAFSIANVFEVVACNIEITNKVDSPLVNKPIQILIYPNPTKSAVTLESEIDITDENISIFDVLGKKVKVNFSRLADRKVLIDLSGNVPGIYFVRINNGTDFVTQKFTYFPW